MAKDEHDDADVQAHEDPPPSKKRRDEDVEPAGVPRRGGYKAVLWALFFFATTCGLGYLAFKLYQSREAALADLAPAKASADDNQKKAAGLEADLAGCKKERDEHVAGRVGDQKTAADAQATLAATQAELELLRKQRAEAEERLKAFQAITARFQKMIDAGKLKVIIRDGRMIVKLPENILFASGQAVLEAGGVAAVREVAAVLKQFPDRKFMVAGHTDNIPLHGGPFKSNWELSAARGVNVTETLIAGGMNPTNLVAAGYGPFDPIAKNATEAGRAENRRIEIVLLPNLSELPAMPPEAAKPPPAASADAPK